MPRTTVCDVKLLTLVASMAVLPAIFGVPWGAALAQYLPPAGAVQSAPPAQKPVRPPATKSAPEAASPDRGDSQLRQRVEQLEEQLVDLQVVIGTLESLARNAGGAAPSMRGVPAAGGSLGGSDGARLDALETQIRALTAQLEQLADQVRAGGGTTYAPAAGPAPSRGPALQRGGGGAIAAPAAGVGGFGSTVVAPSGDQMASNSMGDASATPGVGMSDVTPFSGDAGNSKQIYETAYGYLLQQNYPAAETAFDDFLKRFPNDPLAGNAQYWLGESLFVRGQYKAAATAFLKGYQTYSKSAKAPESLLKLAMSLDRLGQKDAACSSYAELGSRFPSAPNHVKTRAQSERQRAGC